ncbi:MAG: phosphotransferase enzyme family protein [Actinopolymorphaceae bacterium]
MATDDRTQSQASALEDLARSALEWYCLAPTTRLRPLSLGNNATFEVLADATTGRGTLDSSVDARPDSRFVLRVHRPGYRSVAHTRSELQFLQAVGKPLGDFGVATPQPVPDRDGNLVVRLARGAAEADSGPERHGDLLTWVDGQVRVPGEGLGPRAVHRLGQALGHLHNASQSFEPPAGFDLPRWDADGMFAAEASPFRPLLGLEEILAPRDRKLFDELADRARELFDTLDGTAGSFGVIHVDYILGNVFLRRRAHGWDVSVFDFDDCGWGYYLYDLCPLLGNLAGYPGAILDNPGYPPLRRAFLDGYRSARPLPPEWEAHLPLLMAARHANHCFTTAGLDVSPTPVEDAAWRMDLARRCLDLAR